MKIENLEINESEGVIILNKKTYRAESEAVMSDIERNVKDLKYTVDYVKSNQVGVICQTKAEWETVSKMLDKMWISCSFYTYGEGSIISGNTNECGFQGGYFTQHYDLITAERFIKDNQPDTVEQAEPKWRESFEVLEFHNGERDGIITNIGGDAWNFEVNPNQATFTLAQLIGFTTDLNSQVVIFKIRRKSDGAVFTVGDKANFGTAGTFVIDKIEIVAEEVVLTDAAGYHNQANVCHPYTEPALPTLQEKENKEELIMQVVCLVTDDENKRHEILKLIDKLLALS